MNFIDIFKKMPGKDLKVKKIGKNIIVGGAKDEKEEKVYEKKKA